MFLNFTITFLFQLTQKCAGRFTFDLNLRQMFDLNYFERFSLRKTMEIYSTSCLRINLNKIKNVSHLFASAVFNVQFTFPTWGLMFESK